jgi:hypothetical protein
MQGIYVGHTWLSREKCAWTENKSSHLARELHSTRETKSQYRNAKLETTRTDAARSPRLALGAHPPDRVRGSKGTPCGSAQTSVEQIIFREFSFPPEPATCTGLWVTMNN